MAEWAAFYSLDPWGEQRADMRLARLVWATLAPHAKTPIDENDHMLFPEDALALPDDVDPQEREWMLKLDRVGG